VVDLKDYYMNPPIHTSRGVATPNTIKLFWFNNTFQELHNLVIDIIIASHA